MVPTLEQLGIDKLTTAERFALAQTLWDSVQESLQETELAPEIKSELDRRLERADANPEAGKSWEEVLAEARARWKK